MDLGKFLAVTGQRRVIGSVADIVSVGVIGTPHGDPLLAGFLGLQQAEAILIKITNKCV